jgi:hypothetical protein
MPENMPVKYACIVLVILALVPARSARAQNGGKGLDSVPPLPLYVQVGKTVYNGDSIPDIITPPCYVYPPMTFRNEGERRAYTRLVANVKKVLPYAKLAKETLMETYEFVETLPNEKERKAHLKLVEDGIKEQYKPVVKRMSRSQGKLLIKLIYRECDQSSYELIQAFLGSFKAAYYQFFAGIFGSSLKKSYDPKGEDRDTERVVRLVESGQL